MWDENKHPRDKNGRFTITYSLQDLKRMSVKELKLLCLDEALKETIPLPDIHVGRSLGAMALNYDVLDLKTGEIFHFAPNTYIQNIEVFCGYGTKTPYRRAYKYANKIGGKPEEWQHVKGIGILSTQFGDVKAEVHWSEHYKYGRHDFFVKEWLE